MYIVNYIERLAYVEVVNNPKTNYNRPCLFPIKWRHFLIQTTVKLILYTFKILNHTFYAHNAMKDRVFGFV